MKMPTNRKAIDLFAGCGGMSLGFQNAGFEMTCAADNWQPAIKVYQANFKHEIHNLDLDDIDESTRKLAHYKASIIIGGPPCQDFSQAGKRNENLGRGNLTISFARIVSILKPKYFVMENVDQLTKTEIFKQFSVIINKAGYGMTVRLLDASLCGVPQKRKRYFVIGGLNAADDFLGIFLDKHLSSKSMTMRDYFGDGLKLDFYYRHPWSYRRRGIYSIDEPSPTIRGVNRPIPPGYPGHHLDATKDLEKVRPLTTEERAWVQTFPKGFRWVGNKTDMEQLIGNAVPVKLAEFVATCLLDYLDSKILVSDRYSQPLLNFD